MDRQLLYRLIQQMPPERLGMLIAKMRDAEMRAPQMKAPPRQLGGKSGPLDLFTQKPITGPIRGAY